MEIYIIAYSVIDERHNIRQMCICVVRFSCVENTLCDKAINCKSFIFFFEANSCNLPQYAQVLLVVCSLMLFTCLLLFSFMLKYSTYWPFAFNVHIQFQCNNIVGTNINKHILLNICLREGTYMYRYLFY